MDLFGKKSAQLKSRISTLEADNSRLQNENYVLQAKVRQLEALLQHPAKNVSAPTSTPASDANAKPNTFEIRNQIGTKFEDDIIALLCRRFCEDINTGKAKLIRNLQFKTNGRAQTDLLFLHSSGIYIIECKYWNGYVIGKYGWDGWFKIYCKTHLGAPIETGESPPIMNYFPNPIKQIKRQGNELKTYLNAQFKDEGYQCHHIVVFGDYSNMAFMNMPTLKGNDTHLDIGNKNDMLKAIQHRQATLTEASALSLANINKIYAYLKDEPAITFDRIQAV